MNAEKGAGRAATGSEVSPRAAAASSRLRAWIAKGKEEKRKAWLLCLLAFAFVVAKESVLLLARRDTVRPEDWVPVAVLAFAMLVSAGHYVRSRPRPGKAA